MWSWFTSLKRINNRMTISLCNFPGNSDGKASAYMWETRVRSLGQEDPLEKEMATHSSILAWKIPWTEEPGRLQSIGSQRVRHDWATSLYYYKQNKHPTNTSFMIYIKNGIKSMYLSNIRHIYDFPPPNIIPHNEKLKAFPLRSRVRHMSQSYHIY